MPTKFLSTVCFFITFFSMVSASCMTIERGGMIFITVSGTINAGDEKNFEVEVGRGLTMQVELNSNGGDVETALKIGRIVRERKLHTIIQRDAGCASACVFVLLGGVQRSGEGQIGLHRPYFGALPANATQQDILNANRALSTKIKAFLGEMNIGNELLSAMQAIPPNSMRWLSRQEAQNFGVYGTDVVYDELRVAKNAEIYGVTSAAFRARAVAATAACKAAGEISEPKAGCFDMNFYGLSSSDYTRLNARALERRRKCNPGHDCILAVHQCLRSVMSGASENCSK